MALSKAFLSGLLLILVSTVRGAWEDGDDGVDRAGGDLPSMPIYLAASYPASECAKMCGGNAQCVAWAYTKPNCGGANAPSCYLKQNIMKQTPNPCRVSGVKGASLVPLKYVPLPLGAIQPLGWMKKQLSTQAAGLSGHLPLFWADVANSSWIGGTADGGLHERTPYWMNGFLPLAYQLKDANLIALVEKYISYILSHQAENGWLGLDDDRSGNMYWSKYQLMFSLRHYYEVTNNNSVLTAMFKWLHAARDRLFQTPMGNSWSAARWQDLVLTVHWLLDNHPNGEEQFLWDLAELVHDQGFTWKEWYNSSSFPQDAVPGATLYTHGVNNGQAIKSGGVWYRQSHNQSDTASSYQRVSVLDKYHGQASGIFACDEHLAGKMPSRGTELCTVVEAMYSFEVLLSIHGDPMFAERAEQLGYNALPATITPNMWEHQYLQQANEINAMHSDDHIWTHDGPDSTIYGLAPNYGCCTANFNQGWPKLLQNAVMTTPDRGTIAIAIYAPLEVGVDKTVLSMDTNYPFDETVSVKADCSDAGGKDLLFRVPSWTEGASVSINGGSPVAIDGPWYRTHCQGQLSLTLTFPMKIRLTKRYNNATSVYHGALLYALSMTEKFQTLRNYSYDSKDIQITTDSPWNYALILGDQASDYGMRFERLNPTGEYVFSQDGVPTRIHAKGCLLKSWGVAHNAAEAPPPSPVSCDGASSDITLLPFGATDLRIAELPTAK